MNNLNYKQFDCTGCFLCSNVCPTKAITMVKDDEGFFCYQIDENKCINCGMCIKKCPKLNDIKKNSGIKHCYAAFSKDDKILLNSSSGGIFSELAKSILEMNGIVIGAAWIDNDVKHIAVTNAKDLFKLRGSKYIQSDLNDVYSIIKDSLKKGQKVLFSGTPCQIVAVKSLIGDNENLYLVDIVCHGVPSKKTLDYSIKQRYNKEKVKVDFRNKISGWHYNFSLKYDGDNFSVVLKNDEDGWFKEYLKNKFLKKDCYNCIFTGLNKASDITLGDFWGISNIDLELSLNNRDKGVSLVLINSVKGEELFKTILNNIVYNKEPLEKAVIYNERIVKGVYSNKEYEARIKFYNDFKNGKICFKDGKNNTQNIKIKIKSLIKKIIKINR